MASTLQAVCAACGAVIADLDVHAAWHALIADVAPTLATDLTTRDPETGEPVIVRPCPVPDPRPIPTPEPDPAPIRRT